MDPNKDQPNNLTTPAREPIALTVHRNGNTPTTKTSSLRIEMLEGNRARITY
jgi:hypothetical protein